MKNLYKINPFSPTNDIRYIKMEEIWKFIDIVLSSHGDYNINIVLQNNESTKKEINYTESI